MPEPLIVNTKSTIADVEALIGEIFNSALDRDLLLPNSLSSRELGGTAAMLQLIATWRRQCPSGRIRIHVQKKDPDVQVNSVVENFMALDHGFTASQLSDQIMDRTGERSLGSVVGGHIVKRLDEMKDVNSARRGNKVMLVAVDDTTFDRPPTLYQPSRTAKTVVRSDDGFFRLARELLGATRIRPEKKKRLTDQETTDLGRLLHELFSNTHTWARSDELNTRYQKSVRGVRIEEHNLSADDRRSAVGDQPALAQYMEETKPNYGQRLHMVELSVFDCGPGLAARQLPSQGVLIPSFDQEVAAVARCLSKHFTTSVEETKGQGLHRVLGTISDLGGFLTLRTGHLRLYRDFVKNPYDPETEGGASLMESWNSEEEIPELAPVAGAFYTLLYPVRYVG